MIKEAYFYSQNKIFVNELYSYPAIFTIYDEGAEYLITVNPLNIEDLKEICKIFVKHSSSSEDLHEKTNDFFWNGPLDDHFRGLFGEEKGNQIMDQALAYLDSLFE
jgi:hypothetical protein